MATRFPSLARRFATKFPSLPERIQKHKPFLRETGFHLFAFVTWIPALIFFNNNVGEVAWIEGPSMYPYLNTNKDGSLKQDTCWVDKWNPLQGLRRGMIVTFWSPTHPDKKVVKRVVALEGDIVYTRPPFPEPTIRVPAGHVWVEGDGGERLSVDSNTYGPISMNLIIGRVSHIVWPLEKAGKVNWWDWRPTTQIVKAKKNDVLVWS